MSHNKRTKKELLHSVHNARSKAAKSGVKAVVVSADELAKKTIDYVQDKGRISDVHRAYEALMEVLTNPDVRKVLAIEVFVKIMVEIFVHLAKL